jgi:hypothetical protein
VSKTKADPQRAEIAEQVARESSWRSRLGVPAVAGGVLYLLSGIIVSSVLSGAPTVGPLQAIGPALEGVANPAVSPRAPEVKFIHHHSTQLILGSLLAAIAIVVLTLILVLLVKATRFRRPNLSPAVLPLVIIGGTAVAIVTVGHQVVSAILTHNFVSGHDFSNHAVDQALTKGSANVATEYLDLIAGLTLAAGMFMAMLGAMRVGLINRWMAYLGMFSAFLIFLPIGGAELEVIPSFWMVAMGILYIGRWPNGEPPAWAAGEARPWPSPADVRAQREAARGSGAADRNGARARDGKAPAGDTAPAPAPRPKATSRRRRKRGARQRPSSA